MLEKIKSYELEAFLINSGYSFYIEREKDNNNNEYKLTYNIKTINYDTYMVIFIKDQNNNYRLKFRYSSNIDYERGLLSAIKVQHISKDRIEIVRGENLYLSI